MKRVHYNHSGSGIPACRNGLRKGQVFETSPYCDVVTCKKCQAEIRAMHKNAALPG